MSRIPVAQLLVIWSCILIPGIVMQAATRADQEPKSADEYRYHIDLRNVDGDKIAVELATPKIEVDSINFCFPKIVPGIYGTQDYGTFVSNVDAFDETGQSLEVAKLDVNRWTISNARRLTRITYTVDDSWEEFDVTSRIMYRSAGSCFDLGERFVINHNCLFGYFEGMSDVTYRIGIDHSDRMIGATSLHRTVEKTEHDEYLATNYRELVDNPIVYGKADIAKFGIGNTEIQIAVFNEDSEQHAAHFARILQPVMEAQARYLGGELPVRRYTFIIVWETGVKGRMLGDGLEHAQSTLVLLNVSSLANATDMIRRICAHEFFHILMPLTIKSEEIANYDFNSPKQSRHLWLYEGMTEYSTIHMPVKEGLVDHDDILRSLEKKIIESQRFRNDISLTELSRNAMEMQDQYFNFYLKGVLACMCLDIELRDMSRGKMGTQELLQKLSNKYGAEKYFRDDELFDVIAELTSSSIGDWLERYIGGTERLPLHATLARVGIDYDSNEHKLTWSSDATKEQLTLRKQWLEKTTAESGPVAETKSSREQNLQEQNYRVHLDPENPLVARVVLDLPVGTGEPRTLNLRGVTWGLKQQVSDVRGDDTPLKNPSDGTWVAPADCKTVSWKIHFQSSFAGPTIASDARNVYFRNGRWWLISEPASLLRISSASFASTITFEPKTLFQIGAMPSGANRWLVPGSKQAPEYYAVGRVKPAKTDVDGFQIFHVADNAQQVEKLGLQVAHAEALRYLLKLFPHAGDVPKSEKRLLIFWIGVNAGNRQLGGSAGRRSFVSNYLLGQPTHSDTAMNLMVIAHEQFHQLTELCLGDDISLPGWVNESLAQYYGLKSLAATNLPADAVSTARKRFIDPEREIEHGLVELSRKYKQGDRSVYPLFYSQGATFWADVDHEISAATSGTKSLDDFLPTIFRAKFDETGTLPQSILNPLREVIGDKLDGLLQKHVGT